MKTPKRDYVRENQIERIDHIRAKIGTNIGSPKLINIPVCYEGIKQTFAMYYKQYTHYYGQPTVKLTRIGGMVCLDSFYDFGRIPLSMGGSGRVTWVGTKGSKWLTFDTWQFFREKVYDCDKGICQKCGKPAESYVCDHIIPLFKGGRDWWEDPEMSNFQTLCVVCNKKKTKIDVAKPKVIKQKLGLKVVQYAGFVFEEPDKNVQRLDNFLSVNP